MNVQSANHEILSPWRRIPANFFSGISVVFTALWLAVLWFMLFQLLGGVLEGGELFFAGIFLTAPPVFVSTGMALLLVGPRHCKAAWISALLWLSPMVLGLVGSLFVPAHK